MHDRTGNGADRHRLILDAAISVIAHKGDCATRISDIAQQAEIAYGLVYHYFEVKEKNLDSFSSSAGAD